MASQAGAGMKALGDIYSGIMQQKTAGVEADQMRINARQPQAAGETGAAIMRKKTAVVQSAARAAAGASGAGVTDVGVQEVQAETGRTGEYNALTALYAGNSEATVMRNQAALTEWGGEQAAIAAGEKAVGDAMGASGTQGSGASTLGEQGMSMLEKYGGQLPEWFEAAA